MHVTFFLAIDNFIKNVLTVFYKAWSAQRKLPLLVHRYIFFVIDSSLTGTELHLPQCCKKKEKKKKEKERETHSISLGDHWNQQVLYIRQSHVNHYNECSKLNLTLIAFRPFALSSWCWLPWPWLLPNLADCSVWLLLPLSVLALQSSSAAGAPQLLLAPPESLELLLSSELLGSESSPSASPESVWVVSDLEPEDFGRSPTWFISAVMFGMTELGLPNPSSRPNFIITFFTGFTTDNFSPQLQRPN